MTGVRSWRLIPAFLGVVILLLQGAPGGAVTGPASPSRTQYPPKVSNPVGVELDGVALGSLGALIDGWTFVDADILVPILGGKITHAPGAPTATIRLHGKTVIVAAGHPVLQVGPSTVALPAPPRLIGTALYVPLRELASSTGLAAVAWSQSTMTVNLLSTTAASIARLQSPQVAIEAAQSTAASSDTTVPVSSSSSATSAAALASTSSETSAASAAPVQPVPPPSSTSAAVTQPAVSTSSAAPQPSQADVLLMARVIDSELPTGPEAAQIGIGAVIMNRVHSPLFADTLDGVIYEPGQFQGVGSPLFEERPSAQVLQAATDALQGQDPTGGALYFYNPATTTSAWALSLQTLATIGPLCFAK